MIIIYLSPSCTSCRKAYAWLEEYNIPFIERNIMEEPPTKTELEKILSLTAKGTEEIVSTRSKAFKRLKIDIEDMSLQELYELIYDHPEILRKPIIIDHRRIQIGYNESEIRQFVPKKVRRRELNKAKSMIATFDQMAE
ncbi:regulatory protein spx [Atopostipes suicloacalis DSM 15692]|uniref:Regulatory protein spx n=1 Tax=Atopostipes suicloacalis DSM 15692 TaxID=1121025 RepID=A0A1M4YSV6_9LACT|nr:transcriptional regulator Spx [Atopostipes suicloacalis]SHF08899.1 regulatory protein spx [Atopostipes suicloacalis DSM 15692]